jgi:HSP20 family molecular chaperone IbpA
VSTKGAPTGREDNLDKSSARREYLKLRVAHGETLGELEKVIQRAIAYRAYAHYSERGRSHGNDLEDWFRAEGELVKPESVEILDGGNEWIVQARTPGFKAEEIQIGASPRKVVIWGQTAHALSPEEKYPQQLLGEIELPSIVVPEKSSATSAGDWLEIRISKEHTLASN